ncbi:MAG: ABC transporter ATP-binding protein [Thermodesulfobacteriota bacterium]
MPEKALGSRPVLTTESLTLKFGGLTAVNRVNLTLEQGETRVLIGPNGAGKTSLFNLITGMLKPTSGRIFFQGREITGQPPYRRIKLGMGRSFQLVNLFPKLTVRKNIEIAVQASLKARVSPFELVNRRRIALLAEEVLERYEWESDPEVRAGVLVYGDQKKLETVMALVSEPDLLLLDEPAAGVDEKEIGKIIATIKAKSEGRTVLITDHDIKFVMKIADRITVMDQGSVIAEGSPAEIACNPRVEEIYLGGTC